MGDLNLNVNVSTSSYVPVDAQVSPVVNAPLPPQVTLGPLDTTDTADSGVPPPTSYTATAETPQLLQTVTSQLQTVANTASEALAGMEAGNISTDGNGDALNPDSVISVMGNTLQNTLDTVNAQIEILQNLPDDTPGKMEMLSFLQSVSSAITELKELLAQMDASDPKSAQSKLQASLDRIKQTIDSSESQLSSLSLDDLVDNADLSWYQALQLDKAISLMERGCVMSAMDKITDILRSDPQLLSDNSLLFTTLLTTCMVDATLKYSDDSWFLQSMQFELKSTLEYVDRRQSSDPSVSDSKLLGLKMTITALTIMSVATSTLLSDNLLDLQPWKLNALVQGSQIGNSLLGLNGLDANTMYASLFIAAAAPFMMAMIINATLQEGNFDLAFSAVSNNVGLMLLAMMSGTQNIFGVTLDPTQTDAALLGLKMAMTTAIMLAITMSASESNGLVDCSQGLEGMLQACQVGFAAISLAGLDETAQNFGNLAVTCAVMAVIIASCMSENGLVV
jgi:hypothetical protein